MQKYSALDGLYFAFNFVGNESWTYTAQSQSNVCPI